MKKPWIKWCLLGLLVVAALVGGPILINECYKIGAGYITIWNADDVLAYYGAIVASFGAAVGVFVSIKAANKNYQDDVRARVLPFIAVTPFERRATVNLMALLQEQAERNALSSDKAEVPAVQYEEYKLNRIYFIITEAGIEVKYKLDKHQQSILEHAGNMWVSMASGVNALQRTDYFSLPLEIENVGNGTAVNLRVGFNRKKVENKHRFVRPMMLKQGQTLYIHIFSTADFDAVSGEYVLEFYYEDIYGNRYSQEFPVNYGKNKNGQEYQSIDLVGKQAQVTEEKANADA